MQPEWIESLVLAEMKIELSCKYSQHSIIQQVSIARKVYIIMPNRRTSVSNNNNYIIIIIIIYYKLLTFILVANRPNA